MQPPTLEATPSTSLAEPGAEPPPQAADNLSAQESISSVENVLSLSESLPPSQTPPAEPAPSPEPPEIPSSPAGFQLTLQSVSPQARGRTILALRQELGLSPQDAAAYIMAAPALLAVGLPAEKAESLRAALANAGAMALLQGPPPREEAKPVVPEPEPRRRISREDEIVHQVQFRTGLRTVTGLDIGKTNTYLAYARAELTRLSAPPEMVSLEAQTAIPTVVRPTKGGQPTLIGEEALKAWVQAPQTVSVGMLDQVGEDDDILPALHTFLETLVGRLNRVLMPGALSMSEGATTTLGIPAQWDQGRIMRLVEMSTQAGFPVSHVVPYPLAILTHHRQQGTLPRETKQEQTMVIDWGGSSLSISFVEHGGDLPNPRVFEHIEHSLGGTWFDGKIYQALKGQIPSELGEADQRAFQQFVQNFKVQMSKSFAEGKNSCAQYCVIPAGLPPVRVHINRDEFESAAREGLDGFRQAMLDAVNTVGLKPEHMEHIILAGGGAQWYFAREIARDAMGQTPLIGANPEEACARGLAVFHLDLPDES